MYLVCAHVVRRLLVREAMVRGTIDDSMGMM